MLRTFEQLQEKQCVPDFNLTPDQLFWVSTVALALSLVPRLSLGQPDWVTNNHFEIGRPSCPQEHSCKIGNMHALEKNLTDFSN